MVHKYYTGQIIVCSFSGCFSVFSPYKKNFLPRNDESRNNKNFGIFHNFKKFGRQKIYLFSNRAPKNIPFFFTARVFGSHEKKVFYLLPFTFYLRRLRVALSAAGFRGLLSSRASSSATALATSSVRSAVIQIAGMWSW